MKTRCVLEKFKTLPLLVAGLFFVTSCDNEGDSFNPLLVSIQIPADVLDSDSEIYMLASDANGDIIEFKVLEDGETNVLSSDSYKEGTFTLSLISRNASGQYKYLDGSSYYGVKRGLKVVLDESTFNETEEYLEYTSQNFDINNASYYLLSSNGDIDYVYPDDLSGSLYLAKSPTRIFVTKYNQDYQPSGFLFPTTTYTASQSPAINLSGSYTAFQTETVTFSESVYAGVEVYGRPAANNYDEQYEVYDVSSYGDELDIKFPGTTFPAYSSMSYVEGEDYYYSAYHKSQRSDFSMMDVNASVEIDGPTLVYTVTGDGEIVSLDFDQEGTNFEYLDWEIYANTGSNQSVTLPKLPAAITTGFSSYSYNNWEADEEIEVLEVEGIDSIDEYLNAELDGSQQYSLNAKYVYLYLGSGAARKARTTPTLERKQQVNLAKLKSRFEKTRKTK